MMLMITNGTYVGMVGNRSIGLMREGGNEFELRKHTKKMFSVSRLWGV